MDAAADVYHCVSKALNHNEETTCGTTASRLAFTSTDIRRPRADPTVAPRPQAGICIECAAVAVRFVQAA